MPRKISYKMGLLFTLVLLIFFAFGATTAFADETKYVNVSVPTTVTCPDYAFSSVMQGISGSTYSYDVDGFKGTLSFVSITNLTSSFYYSYPGVNLYTYSFNRNYAGYVTKPDPVTINVTATQHYNITAPLYAEASIRQGIANSTYAYDDGTYRGTLAYVSLTNWTATYSTSYPGTDLYNIQFDVTYSGLATSY